jgi:hypothetical protein
LFGKHARLGWQPAWRQPADRRRYAGVAEIDRLQAKLQTIGYLGHRHHVSLATGHLAAPVCEAFEKYLHYQDTRL